MSADDELIRNVKDELVWQPIVDPKAIAVSARDGKVTLRGTVGSLREKRAARKVAERVFGVVAVHNELEVRLLNAQRRDDADLRADVLQALMLDGLVPETIDVKVDEGFVTLAGTAEWQYQRDEADLVASSIVGALDVVDEIELTHPPSPDPVPVEEAIGRAFRRSAALDASKLDVSTEDGTVTISGQVRSWAEHDDAIAAAWAAPGVRQVRDHMTVGY
jgi:osmotically-inducible protein OsmY